LLDDDAAIADASRDRRRAQIGIGVAITRRVRGSEQILGVEIRAQLPRGRRVEQLDGDAQTPLERGAPPCGSQLLQFFGETGKLFGLRLC
jgi:hypothetical protein